MAVKAQKVTYDEVAAPSTPAAGEVVTYAKADGLMYSKDDAGTETAMSGAAVTTHIADTTDAHDASAVSFDATGLGNTSATEVQTALEDFDAAITAAGGGGGAVFKRSVRKGDGNKTTTSTSYTPVDSTNLGYLTHTLAVGDVVRLTLSFGFYATSTTETIYIDVEVDQPTSSNVNVAANAEQLFVEGNAVVRQIRTIVATFTATEAGSHGFRPVWKGLGGNSITMCNAASGADDIPITWIVEKLGASA